MLLSWSKQHEFQQRESGDWGMRAKKFPSNTFDEYYLCCPYCGHEQEICDGGPSANNGKEEWQCDSCEKKFFARADIVYSTDMDCGLNAQEHDYQLDDLMRLHQDEKTKWLKCTRCEHEKVERP
jgi:hypothetical protein